MGWMEVVVREMEMVGLQDLLWDADDAIQGEGRVRSDQELMGERARKTTAHDFNRNSKSCLFSDTALNSKLYTSPGLHLQPQWCLILTLRTSLPLTKSNVPLNVAPA